MNIIMKLHSIKDNSLNSIKRRISQETLRNIRIVKLDYLRLFKYTLIISTGSLILFLFHRQIPYFNTHYTYCVSTETNKQILDKIGPIDYIPTFYMPSCLSMMIYNEIKDKPEIKYRRQYISTSDGGVISFDWAESKHKAVKEDKLLVILHGLTGGSETSYIRELVDRYIDIPGFKVVAVNYRGIAESPLLTPFVYHAGYTDDLHTALTYLMNNYPELKCYTIGTSMGANIFTKLLANHREFDQYIKGFISVSNPFNCFEVEKRNRGGILDKFIIRRQQKYIEKHKHVLEKVVGIIYVNFRH